MSFAAIIRNRHQNGNTENPSVQARTYKYQNPDGISVGAVIVGFPRKIEDATGIRTILADEPVYPGKGKSGKQKPWIICAVPLEFGIGSEKKRDKYRITKDGVHQLYGKFECDAAYAQYYADHSENGKTRPPKHGWLPIALESRVFKVKSWADSCKILRKGDIVDLVNIRAQSWTFIPPDKTDKAKPKTTTTTITTTVVPTTNGSDVAPTAAAATVTKEGEDEPQRKNEVKPIETISLMANDIRITQKRGKSDASMLIDTLNTRINFNQRVCRMPSTESDCGFAMFSIHGPDTDWSSVSQCIFPGSGLDDFVYTPKPKDTEDNNGDDANGNDSDSDSEEGVIDVWNLDVLTNDSKPRAVFYMLRSEWSKPDKSDAKHWNVVLTVRSVEDCYGTGITDLRTWIDVMRHIPFYCVVSARTDAGNTLRLENNIHLANMSLEQLEAAKQDALAENTIHMSGTLFMISRFVSWDLSATLKAHGFHISYRWVLDFLSIKERRTKLRNRNASCIIYDDGSKDPSSMKVVLPELEPTMSKMNPLHSCGPNSPIINLNEYSSGIGGILTNRDLYVLVCRSDWTDDERTSIKNARASEGFDAMEAFLRTAVGFDAANKQLDELKKKKATKLPKSSAFTPMPRVVIYAVERR